MDLGLAGKVAVVTGGSSGIGLATARALLQEGVSVVICGRDAGRLEAARQSLSDHGAVLARQCDVLVEREVEDLVAAVTQWRGSCDLLVNNAGQGRVSTFESTSDDAWREELELKFFSQVRTIRAFMPLLRRSAAGSIVAVNSLLAYQPEPHMVCTSAARAGVQNLLKSLSVEFAPAIRVNAVVVGLISSGQWERRFAARADQNIGRDAWFSDLARDKHIPLGRLGAAEEVARAIVFLGAPVSAYTTGATLEISGGLSRHF